MAKPRARRARIGSPLWRCAALTLTVAVLGGCGAQSQSEQDKAGTVARAYIHAFAAGDGNRMCSLLTTSLRRKAASLAGSDQAGNGCAELLTYRAGAVRDALALDPVVSAVRISGSRASATIRTRFGIDRLPLARDGGRWRVSGPVRNVTRVWLKADYRVRAAAGSSSTYVAQALAARARLIIGTDAEATPIGGDEIRLSVEEPVRPADLTLVTRPDRAQIALFDWESDTVTPSGKPVDLQLRRRDGSAFTVSQGTNAEAPGDAGAGSLSLYDAVKLASTERPGPGGAAGSVFYGFGRAGTVACAGPRARRAASAGDGRCLLSGPAEGRQQVEANLPAGVERSQAEIVGVPGGWKVVAAIPPWGPGVAAGLDPSGQFFVLRDSVGLSRADITDAHVYFDGAGAPDLVLEFTPDGAAGFQHLTAVIARRGATLSAPDLTLRQHVAVVLDDRLLSVLYVDFRRYPDGIPGTNGFDLKAAFTPTQAPQLAGEIAAPPLTAELQLVRSTTFTRAG